MIKLLSDAQYNQFQTTEEPEAKEIVEKEVHEDELETVLGDNPNASIMCHEVLMDGSQSQERRTDMPDVGTSYMRPESIDVLKDSILSLCSTVATEDVPDPFVDPVKNYEDFACLLFCIWYIQSNH